jgi:hypothetical protein
MVVARLFETGMVSDAPEGDALGRVPTDIAVPTEGLLR